jgi:hypothetical protein
VLALSVSVLWSSGAFEVKRPPRAAAPARALTPVVTADAVSAAWGQPSPDGPWFAFEPPVDDFAPAELDLRELNEKRAGDLGPLRASGRSLVRGPTEQRLWGVNVRDRALDLSDQQMSRLARGLAKRGVNLVRLHLRYWREDDVRKVDPKRLERTHRLVAELRSSGISSSLSIFFPYWLKPKPGSPIAGYDGSQRAFGLLYSDAGFREIYRGWWRQILTPKNPYTGRSLAEDPALAMVELVNEDSTLFWTFETHTRLPPPQTREVERAFGTFLAKRYGSVRAALARYGGGPVRGDAPEEGRAGVVSLSTITRTTTARTRETAEFLATHMRDLYSDLRRYLVDDLGVRGSVVCSNWVTANSRILGPLDKWANGACDVMDQHGYFSGPHIGKDSAYLIRAGQRYDDRSSLRPSASSEETSQGGSREIPYETPVHLVGFQDKPGMISELGWPAPNRFRAELPLLALAYGSLHGASALALFIADNPGYAPALTKFGITDPAVFGQFPGVALAFRRRYVAGGRVVASVRPSLADLFALRGGPFGGATVVDALRRPDVGDARGDDATPSIDPFAPFVGRVEVSVSERGGPTSFADLAPFVDRGAHVVRSTTGEITLDFSRGLLALDASRVQGVAGFLGSAAPLELSVLRVETGLEYGALLAVSLDGEPLRSSNRILLQVATEVENTDFSAPGRGLRTIANPGRAPLRMRRVDARVALKRPDFAALRAVALDANGRKVREAKSLAGGLVLLPEGLYYLITAP